MRVAGTYFRVVLTPDLPTGSAHWTICTLPNNIPVLTSSIVSVEFEIMNPEIVCKNVVITIPCPGSKAPKIISADGKADYISREKALAWQIDEISEDNSSGALEFTVPKAKLTPAQPPIFILTTLSCTRPRIVASWAMSHCKISQLESSAFFPIEVNFSSPTLYSKMKVGGK
eukprot:1350842-Amorphochlora_amoeboformis.AAC.3